MKIHLGTGLSGVLYLLVHARLGAAVIHVGSGPNVSYFTLETPNLGVRHYAVSYTYDPIVSPLGGSDLLGVIADSDPDISFVLADFGTPSQPNEFFSSLTFEGVTESNDFSPGGSTFVYWVAGGQSGAAGLGIPNPVAIPGDDWVLGAGLSVNFRLVEPGSNDALVFAPTQTEPSNVPIPEPSSFFLLLLSLPCFLIRQRQTLPPACES